MNSIKQGWLLQGSLKPLILVLSFTILALLPLYVDNPYLTDILISIFLYAYLGIAWNIVGGYCGQISLGHAAYFGLGAYISTTMFTKFGVSPWIGMIIAALLVGLIAVLLGYPSLRMRGPYFVFFTIAFAEFIRIAFSNWRWVGASMGIIIPFKGSWSSFTFIDKANYYYIALALMIIGLLVSYLVTRSRTGKYFLAIREDETMAEALGINTAAYKTVAFMISASLMAAGGTFYAQYTLYIDPDSTMSLSISLMALLIPVVGGAGTLTGPVLGAAILVPLWEYSRAVLGGRLAGVSLMTIGLITMIAVISFPQGFTGLLRLLCEGGVIRWLSRASKRIVRDK